MKVTYMEYMDAHMRVRVRVCIRVRVRMREAMRFFCFILHVYDAMAKPLYTFEQVYIGFEFDFLF